MTIWEIVILMVVGTLCITTGIGFVYSSIVNTVERYQVRKTKRELEIYTKVMEAIPGVFEKIISMAAEKEQKKQNEIEEFRKRLEKLNRKDEDE